MSPNISFSLILCRRLKNNTEDTNLALKFIILLLIKCYVRLTPPSSLLSLPRHFPLTHSLSSALQTLTNVEADVHVVVPAVVEPLVSGVVVLEEEEHIRVLVERGEHLETRVGRNRLKEHCPRVDVFADLEVEHGKGEVVSVCLPL